ncbi:MAG: serine hydrolase [Caulobacterales bacterium]
MLSTRRLALTGLTAAALASCGRGGRLVGGKGPPLDTKRLDNAFPALADRARPGAFAVGVTDLATAQTWYWNLDRAFPLLGVAKAPLAAAALADVEARRLALSERVGFSDSDLAPPFSLIDQKWPTPPDGYSATIPVSTLITLTLQYSDNTAADVLMKRIGGPGAVTLWLEQKGVADMRLDRYARELQVELAGLPTFRPAWKDGAKFTAARDGTPAPERQAAMDAYLKDPRDTTTVPGALTFLAKLAGGQLLSPAATSLLLTWMEGARAGDKRFKAGLPKGARFAHASNLSETDLGFTPATNDIGVATFADGRRYAIAGFLAGSTATEAERDALFADAARLITAATG